MSKGIKNVQDTISTLSEELPFATDPTTHIEAFGNFVLEHPYVYMGALTASSYVFYRIGVRKQKQLITKAVEAAFDSRSILVVATTQP